MIKGIWYVAGEKLTEPVMVMHPFSLDVRFQRIVAALGTAALYTNQELLKKFLCSIFHIIPDAMIASIWLCRVMEV